MSYPINVYLITGPNRPRTPLAPIGMVVHDTATVGATGINERTYFSTVPRNASAHAFVDWSSVTIIIPFNEVAWGSGYTSNHKFIQVELCVPATHNIQQFAEVWNRAVWFFAHTFIHTLKMTTITTNNLMSHYEVSKRWHETDHTDPTGYFKEYGKTVNDFRKAVQQEINNQLKPKVEVFDMDKIVVYMGDADVFGAVMVAQKFACPLMRKEDFERSGLKAEKIIQIGGKPGSDRFSSFKDAANLI
jgi:N-acetylmuramoyl-L-alanine amidase CwlA